VIALAVAALTVTAGPLAGAGSDSGDADHVLAVVNATGGTMREAGDGYRLVLDGVVSGAVWFSDSPARAAGSATIDELVRAFFSADADPNAALEVLDGPRTGDVVAVELSNPRQRRDGDRLVLDARILDRVELAASALRAHAEQATSRPPARFGAAALFIDDAAMCFFGDGGDGGAGGDAGNGGAGGAGGDGGTAAGALEAC
jgi:hypothetical protein